MPGEVMVDMDSTWFRGNNSSMDPSQLPLGYTWNMINMINIGGLLSCRPGYRCLVTLPKGKLQGGTIFRPSLGLEQFVVAIDGAIYVAPWPFLNFRLLPNIQILPHAKQIWWAQCTQSARRITTDFGSAIEVIPPREVLFIFDGQNTAPGWYDGSQSGHVRNNAFETPSSGPAMWIGDRLWVSQGKNVFASDISNPFSFREQIYLGGTGSFQFNREVTAMARTPNLEFPQLFVYTDEAVSILQANIRLRDKWPQTDGFQREILQVGCTSQRSVVSHFGRLSWMSPSGVVLFDASKASQIDGRVPIRDNEMAVSKSLLKEDLSLVASGAFGQYLLTSVPAEDEFNKHTWVLNDASIETLNDDSGQSWSGYWLGTRPVEWVYGTIAGAERIFHVSVDEDGENRLWEAFRPDRLDNGCPITWALESRGYFGLTSPSKRNTLDCQFMYAQVGLACIEEGLDLGVFYAGGIRGAYKQVLAKYISVDRGSLSFDQELTADSQIFAFKPQSRRVKTEDASQQSAELDSGSCPAESGRNEDIDESFQLMVVGHGPATIRWIRTFSTEEPDHKDEDSDFCDDETPVNAVRFDGAGVKTETLAESIQALSAIAVRRFTSSQTKQLDVDSFSAIGVGSAESIVTQAAADRVAEIIAIKMAEAELISVLPVVLSIGEGF